MTGTFKPSGTAPKDALPAVAARNAKVLDQLPFADTQDFEDAKRGFIETLPNAELRTAGGRVAWTMAPYDFINGQKAPPTVNPSLWRQAQLNNLHGLFEVIPGIYQVRSYDIANMTFVEGKTGVIAIDSTSAVESAAAGLALYRKHRGDRPVTGLIYTHTHTDHWGGATGIVSEADVASGKVPVIAPEHFMKHAISENVIAGNAMLRRAHYQFGGLLPRNARQQVDCGLGKVTTQGSVSLIAPTDIITRTGEERVIDGLTFVFQMAPETEAPAEMHIWLPQYKALNLAENATHNFHNLLPFRGAQVRNSLDWSGYINEAIEMWGSEATVLLGQHHWPVWGNEHVVTHLKQQRDLYKYVHDQTVRLMNHGLKPAEIVERIVMPSTLEGAWHTRGYYGHYRHNSKAIYQHYLGWYDGNPANLDPLPPQETGKRMIAYMGGADAVLKRAREDFEKGEHRFVAQVLSQLVFAEPDNMAAREMLADTFEQLGYVAESGTWRNAYLVAAHELRNGMPSAPSRTPIGAHVLTALETGQLLDYLGIRVNGPKADGLHFVINLKLTDTGEEWRLNLENAVLTYVKDKQAANADATLSTDRRNFEALVIGRAQPEDLIKSGAINVGGDASAVLQLFATLDTFERMFEIVEPVRRRIES